MGKIETNYDHPRDLTYFKVVGHMRAADFQDCLDSYYESGVTPLTLWDFTESDVSAISTDDISHLARYASRLAQVREQGRTAFVFKETFDYGLGRMFETYLEMTGLALEIRLFRDLAKAKEWLGVNDQMVTGSTIYKIGGCIQKTESGRLDRTRTLNLIHELSIAVHSHEGRHILVDLRDAAVQSDMQDLMAFAAECGQYKSGFDKKIAILIPNTAERIEVARRFRTCMDVQGFRLEQFFDYDAAVAWLSAED